MAVAMMDPAATLISRCWTTRPLRPDSRKSAADWMLSNDADEQMAKEMQRQYNTAAAAAATA